MQYIVKEQKGNLRIARQADETCLTNIWIKIWYSFQTINHLREFFFAYIYSNLTLSLKFLITDISICCRAESERERGKKGYKNKRKTEKDEKEGNSSFFHFFGELKNYSWKISFVLKKNQCPQHCLLLSLKKVSDSNFNEMLIKTWRISWLGNKKFLCLILPGRQHCKNFVCTLTYDAFFVNLLLMSG